MRARVPTNKIFFYFLCSEDAVEKSFEMKPKQTVDCLSPRARHFRKTNIFFCWRFSFRIISSCPCNCVMYTSDTIAQPLLFSTLFMHISPISFFIRPTPVEIERHGNRPSLFKVDNISIVIRLLLKHFRLCTHRIKFCHHCKMV